jgi:hypothetical protein
VTLTPVNKFAKFELEKKKTIFYFLVSFSLEKNRYCISDTYFAIKVHKSYIQQSQQNHMEKKKCEGPISKSMKTSRFL